MAPALTNIFLGLQAYVVVFILFHDWIPLGRLNDVKSVQAADPFLKLVCVTLFSTAPFAAGLAASAYYAQAQFPLWLLWLLWLSYGFAIYGMLKTWWLPYLFGPSPDRLARWQKMFGRTHSFLPMRNGMRPDTLHVTLHIVMVAIVVLLTKITYAQM